MLVESSGHLPATGCRRMYLENVGSPKDSDLERRRILGFEKGWKEFEEFERS